MSTIQERLNKFNLVLIILAVLAVVGLWAFWYQYDRGLIVTNMRNPFTWGLYIVMWAFYVGLAAGGLVVSSAIYLFGAEDLKPIAPLASTTAFLFAVASLLMVLPDIGRVDRMLYIFLYPNFSSMIVWDVLVLSTYALLSFIYTLILLWPNLRMYGDRIPVFGGLFKKHITEDEYRALKEKSSKLAKMIAPIALPFAILIHTVTAWVLATQLSRPWWYGGLLAPTFIAAAIASGPAVVVLVSLVVYGASEKYMKSYKLLAKISAVSIIGLLFMYYNDFVVRAWWASGSEFEALNMVLTYYLPIHLTEAVFMILGAIILVKYSNQVKGLIIGNLFIIIGIFAHRFLLLPPAYNYIPFVVPGVSNGEVIEWHYPIAVGEVRGTLLSPELIFVTYWNYVPSIFEILIVLGLSSIILLVLMFLIKYVPYKVEGEQNE